MFSNQQMTADQAGTTHDDLEFIYMLKAAAGGESDNYSPFARLNTLSVRLAHAKVISFLRARTRPAVLRAQPPALTHMNRRQAVFFWMETMHVKHMALTYTQTSQVSRMPKRWVHGLKPATPDAMHLCQNGGCKDTKPATPPVMHSGH